MTDVLSFGANRLVHRGRGARGTSYMSPLEKWKSEKRRTSKAAAARTTLMTISYRALSFMRYVMAQQFMKTFTLGLSSGRARRLERNKQGRDKSQLITLLPLVITASTSTYKLTITCRNWQTFDNGTLSSIHHLCSTISYSICQHFKNSNLGISSQGTVSLMRL